MKQSPSTARRHYNMAYKSLRQYGTEVFHSYPKFPETTEEECALESYDYHDSEFSGWINRQRYHDFRILSDSISGKADWPF